MKKYGFGALTLGASLMWVAVAVSQPPGEGEDRPEGGVESPRDVFRGPPGPPPDRRPGGPRRRGEGGPPPRPHGGSPGGPPGPFELGRVLPPHFCDELDLTAEQRDELSKLEREVKERLNTLLTDEQKERLASIGPPPAPRRGPDGPPGARGRGRPGRPPAERRGPPGPPRPERGPPNEVEDDF